MRPRSFVLVAMLLVAAGACSGEASVDASATTLVAASVETPVDVDPPVDAVHEEADGQPPGGDRPHFEMIESYEEWQSDPLAPLVPNPEQFGSEWGNLGLLRYSEQVLIDPAEEDFGDECPVTEPIVIRDGFYAEFGAGQSPDDAVVIATQGTPDQLESFYGGILAVFVCEAGADLLETTFAEHPSPELPGVIEATRFSSDDNLGQHAEGLLLRRDDLVHLFLISAQDGAEPIDVNPVVARLLADYDAQR